MIGLASRFDWVDLPPQFALFDNDWVIGAALVLYLVEFFADKIPYVDTLWDVLHTAIRPLGGALIAVASLGDASPAVQGLAALLGGTAGRRQPPDEGQHARRGQHQPGAVVELAAEPGGGRLRRRPGLLALNYPVAALAVVAGAGGADRRCAAALARAIRRRFARAVTGPRACASRRRFARACRAARRRSTRICS